MAFVVEQKPYTALPTDSDANGDGFHRDSIDERTAGRRWLMMVSWGNWLWTIFNILLFVSSLTLSTRSLKHRNCTEKDRNTYCEHHAVPPSPLVALLLTESAAPVYDWLDIKTETRHFNNSFWGDHTVSLLQQRPSPEVDAAWDAISGTEAIPVSADEARRMDREPANMWPWPKDLVPGDEPAYVGLIDIFHQLHCLNMMRKAAWPEYYGDLRAKYANHSFPFEDHQLHCQYLLFNVLTCHADVEIVTFHKVRDFASLFPDFAVDRKCRRFSDILAWKNENMIIPPDDEVWKFEVPSSIVQVDPIGLTRPWVD